MSKIQFSSKPTEVKHAIAASFDMCGFSKFCLGPTAHAYLNRYVAALFALFDNAFEDGWRDFFKHTTGMVQVPRPEFAKYTGDGALLLWVREKGEEFTNQFCTSAVSALRRFQQRLSEAISAWEGDWHTHSLPKNARFGIAIRPVHPLMAPPPLTLFQPTDTIDYAGYPINLAVRLQDHCPELGFLIHGPLHPKLDGLLQLNALKMKGTMDEPIYVFADDFQRASAALPKVIDAKFAANIPGRHASPRQTKTPAE